MPKTLRWGVIGSGGIARRRTIPEGIRPADNAVLVAVHSRNARNNAAVAREFGVRAVGSVADLVAAADVDAVYVASPPAAHLEQVTACARAGKHVLCEKPLAVTVAEAEAMVAVCRDAGVRFATAFMMRFSTRHLAALDLVRTGRLGKPVFGRAQLSCWYPSIPGAWRQVPEIGGGGSLIDLGGHCIDLLEMFLGPVRTVSCLTHRTVHEYPVEDSAVVSLAFENGALGSVDAFFCIPDDASRNRLELYGTRGSILADGTLGQEAGGTMRALLGEGDGAYNPGQARGAEPGVPVEPMPRNTYRAEIEEFGRAVEEGRDPVNDGALGIRSQRVLAACYDSARSGTTVRVG
jgi:predicted dehydrogenase